VTGSAAGSVQVLIRHAEAGEHAVDARRALSARGREQTRRLGRLLAHDARFAPGEIWHSPLVRARETAVGLAAELGFRGAVRERPDLEPEDDPEVAAGWLRGEARSVAIVGHEPHLAALVALRVREGGRAGALARGEALAGGVAGAIAMTLHVLPDRTGGAAENMALDFLLLQRYPEPAAPRLRHYGWRRPSFTFGYSQKLAWVRERLPAGPPVDLCRRATGGGIVDHREDWTYALIVPRGHELEAARASESYRAVHESLVAALLTQGVPAALKSAVGPPVGLPVEPREGGPAGVCFESAEVHDVVNRATGAKIAGAAQKRNKRGLLFQGSVWRPAAEGTAGGGRFDWDRFGGDFGDRLAALLGAEAAPTPWPELNEGEVEGLIDQYASADWMAFR
jgi:lipoate-protein ligase A